MISVPLDQFDFASLMVISVLNLRDVAERESVITVIKGADYRYYDGEWAVSAVVSQLHEPGTELFFLYATTDLDGQMICADGGRKPIMDSHSPARPEPVEWMDDIAEDDESHELHLLNHIDCDLEVLGYLIRLKNDRLQIEPACFFLGMHPALCPLIEPLDTTQWHSYFDSMKQFIRYFIRCR
jgi:hypothetical protein